MNVSKPTLTALLPTRNWIPGPSSATCKARIRDHITKRIARDRLMIGWNGTSIATETDPTTNTLLQDVNKGWLQKIRDKAGERYLTGVKIGDATGKTYKNIDAAVFDMLHSLLDPTCRKDADNRAYVSSDMLTDKYLGLIQEHDAPLSNSI